MIMTIGSLVQETSNRRRWIIASSFYILSCGATALLFGALLGGVGALAHRALCGSLACSPPSAVGGVGSGMVGVIAIAYALSDVGYLRLPRPMVMYAVPVTWWRRWQPYGAALAYGAALGVGLTTRIPFGAYYVLCAWCLVQGNVVYGMVMLGTYGLARALTLIPTSYSVYKAGDSTEMYNAACELRCVRLIERSAQARVALAGLLIAFGTYLLLVSVL